MSDTESSDRYAMNLTGNLVGEIRKEAQSDGRTVSNMIRMLLVEALAARDDVRRGGRDE